jgi:hypothetical protein
MRERELRERKLKAQKQKIEPATRGREKIEGI